MAALVAIVFLATVEIVAAAFFEFGVLPIKYRPAIWVATGDVPSDDAWRTEHHAWGAWHKQNARGRDVKSCYEVIYQSNEVGARDASWLTTVSGIPRVMGIGDSFMEGLGVSRQDRFDAVIEGQGYDFLNLGASGHVGPVQYYLIYDQFADDYDHEAVVVFFLPDNDFTDNDSEVWQAKRSSYSYRYRPYFIDGEGGTFEIFYPRARPSKVILFKDWQYKDLGVFQLVADFGRDFTYLYGAVTYGLTLLEERGFDGTGYSGYYDPEPRQVEAARFFLSRIAKRAADADGVPVIVFSIPTLRDFYRTPAESAEPPSSLMLRQLEVDHPNLVFIDGLTAMLEVEPNFERYFLTCDGHWSNVGHRIAGGIIADALSMALRPAVATESGSGSSRGKDSAD